MDNKPEKTEGQELPEVDPAAELESLSVPAGDFEPGADDVVSPEPEPPEVPTDKMLLMAISPMFDIFAPSWEVSNTEKEQLCAAYAQVIDKYFPDFDMGCELNAIIITGMIFATRIGKPRKPPEPEKSDIVGNSGGDIVGNSGGDIGGAESGD